MNVLIPIDFSSAADHAALFAIKQNQLKIKRFIFFYESSSQEAIEKLGRFNAQKNSVHQDAEFFNIVREQGANDREFNEIVKEFSIDLVIRGAEGSKGFFESLFKNNTFHVINNIQCPVISIPEVFQGTSIDKIGYASDLTMLAKEINHIIPIAKPLDVSIDIVHVFPVFPQVIDVTKYNTTVAVQALQQEFNYQKFQFIFIDTEKDNGTIEGLNQYISENKPDMLALFTRERNLFDKVFDPSLTANLAMHIEIPVLSFSMNEIQ